MKYKVYRLNLDGKEVYIGYTSLPLHKRFIAHCSRAKLGTSPMLICRAITKHGRERFNIELLESYDNKAEAIECEIKLIAERKPRYNVHIGGTGGSRPGVQNGMYGKKHSEETKRKMSEARTGLKHTPETKIAMSLTMKQLREKEPERWLR